MTPDQRAAAVAEIRKRHDPASPVFYKDGERFSFDMLAEEFNKAHQDRDTLLAIVESMMGERAPAAVSELVDALKKIRDFRLFMNGNDDAHDEFVFCQEIVRDALESYTSSAPATAAVDGKVKDD